jgi:hypothetical protein
MIYTVAGRAAADASSLRKETLTVDVRMKQRSLLVRLADGSREVRKLGRGRISENRRVDAFGEACALGTSAR